MVWREVPDAPAVTHFCCVWSSTGGAAGVPKSALRRYTTWAGACQAPGPGSGGLNLYLDIDARREVESLERIDRFGRVIDDVHQALVHPHLEVLA